ncbi:MULTISPECIES: M15 family metallopeptidase [Okeania]|uniref:D-alanyl-D-alanine dipeptidase n=1 Tax=Okeania hirsuta TaxID=1458930 RepID=A0A3N6PIP3_9CYAN|nr:MULTISPECIES: M15 family metallopeptidase [Okeania]NES93008.1 D-alanyl-D-alanine dipeptidase [Okeania sp. SIO2B9]RQH26133.1 D-alanyl-D-alanine dipeptidase [Okeania hirsuta]
MKPYQKIKIQECHEPLIPIPLEKFATESPHPYEKLGAPYHLSPANSPYFLRQKVLDSLIAAQTKLQQKYPSWHIQIFDAYRPIAVQQFMVDYTFVETVKAEGLTLDSPELTEAKRQEILELVYQFWAAPSLNPATPPPHSTGAAVDVTLVDANGKTVDMGSPIDELSPRSYPNHFLGSKNEEAQKYNQHRQLLAEVMLSVGFQQHQQEWWHFSLGDQMWAWLTSKENGESEVVARYGRVN